MAILILKEKLIFGPKVSAIRIANRADEAYYHNYNETYYFSGYGPSEVCDQYKASCPLRQMTLPLVNPTECKNRYDPTWDPMKDKSNVFDNNNFCIGNKTMKYFPKGDSGGL